MGERQMKTWEKVILLGCVAFLALYAAACNKQPCNEDVCTFADTGLTWMVNPPKENVDWQQAAEFCDELELDGQSDWRLPTIDELRSLLLGWANTVKGGPCGVTDQCLKPDCNSDKCDGSMFDKGPTNECYWVIGLQGSCSMYWSSSVVEGDDTSVWNVNYFNGYVDDVKKDQTNYNVRCVRK